jgi:PAS domain S-box-containing protein
VIRYASDLTVTGWSHGATLLFGWTHEEALGRRTAELINRPATTQEQAKVEELRTRLTQTGDLNHTDTWYAKDGRAVLVKAHIFATDDGFVGVMSGRQLDAGPRPKLRQINLRLTEDLIAAIEDLRGNMPRERFLRMLIASYVEAAKRDETPDS